MNRNVSADQVIDAVRTALAQQAQATMPQALSPLLQDEVESLNFYPWRRTLSSSDPIDVRDLLLAPDEVFARRAHRLLLGRDPTPAEIRSTDGLSRNWGRFSYLARLLCSAAARQRKLTLTGPGPYRLLAIALAAPRTASLAVWRSR